MSTRGKSSSAKKPAGAARNTKTPPWEEAGGLSEDEVLQALKDDLEEDEAPPEAPPASPVPPKADEDEKAKTAAEAAIRQAEPDAARSLVLFDDIGSVVVTFRSREERDRQYGVYYKLLVEAGHVQRAVEVPTSQGRMLMRPKRVLLPAG